MHNQKSSVMSNSIKKKSAHFVSKIFPKLTEGTNQIYYQNKINEDNDDNNNKRFEKYHLRKLRQQFRGLSFEKDAYRVVKKQVLFQLDLYQNPFNIKCQQHNNSNKLYKAAKLQFEKPKKVKIQVLNGIGTTRQEQKKYQQKQYCYLVRKEQTTIKNSRDGVKFSRNLNNYFSNTTTTVFNPLQSEPDNQYDFLISQNSQIQLKQNPKQNIIQNQQCKIISLSPERKYMNLQFDNHDASLKYYVGPGNNGNLIRKIMKKRMGWTETSQSNSMFNFRWVQNSQNQKYQGTLSQNGYRQLLNHFSFHEEITTKSGLIRNLKTLSEKEQKFNLFDVTPITFEVDFKLEEFCEAELKNFLHFFLQNAPLECEEGKPIKRKEQERKLYFDFVKKIKKIHNLQNHTYQKKDHHNTKPIMKDVYKDHDNYLWLLKPSDLNRGRGIYLFRTLSQLSEILLEYYEKAQNVWKCNNRRKQISSVKEKTRQSTIQNDNGMNIFSNLKSEAFVFQKYIERPMLLNGRKFDIRVWVLLNHELQLYFFKQGYIRTSCEQFKVDKKDLFVHLTNNAVQKNSVNYGNYQTGNQLSFDALESYFQEAHVAVPAKKNHKKTQISKQEDEDDEEDGMMNAPEQQSLQFSVESPMMKISFREHIIPEMKQIIIWAFQSIKKKMNTNSEKYCFEIYGFDFLIDEDYKPWLIQINTNPCIEESSPLLERLLPRMLDDAFSLSLDLIFKGSNSFQSKKQSHMYYSVQKYSNEQNMWELICMLKTFDKKKIPKTRDRKLPEQIEK